MFESFEHDKELAPLTTFGISAKAKLYAEYSDLKDLIRISRTPAFLENEILHIGGGSNLLFVKDFDGIVLHSAIKGIVRYEKNDDEVFVIAGAAEKWTDFVDWTIKEGLSGLENLAGIPGEVGASAVQNVGAYGVEAADSLFAVECFDVETRNTVRFSKEECEFGYRDSKFKHEWKGRYYVLRVSYKLKKDNIARHLDYGPLRKLAEERGSELTTAEVANAICEIRNAKLPDPAKIGSAGSFFKNPVVTDYFYKYLILPEFPDCPGYKIDDKFVKLSAGWLIEHAGLKGYEVGGAAVYDKQCLVLVNKNDATGEDVVKLADHIYHVVKEKYNVKLSPEVNFIDSTIKVTVLGSGTSRGVPEIGCSCKVCKSADPRDYRLRASVLVQTEGIRLLIDASPDLRLQALHNEIDDVDAVLITHEHYDHVGGIDDLRPYAAHVNLPMYAMPRVCEDLKRRLDYCFRDHLYPGVPHFEMHSVENRPFYIKGVKIVPIEVMHGKKPIYGYRIGNFAYITDCKTMSEESKEKLQGLDILIINALRENDHFAHLSFSEAEQLISELKPKKAYLTHFCHEAGLFGEIDDRFPENVHPAFDGEILTC